MKIIIDDKIPFMRGQAERLGTAVYLPGAAITADDVRDADALIVRTRTRCDEAMLKGSRVKFIATATIGFDHIDTAWLAENGIGWTNCPGCNAGSVAQYVESALLLLARAGRIRLDAATTLAVVGVGHVGTQVALMAKRLGLNLLLCDPLRLQGCGGVEEGSAAAGGIADAACCATLDDVCRQADIITFHTPLTRQGLHATFHLASADFFSRLQRRPVVINSSRGEVVDTSALLGALRGGIVREAVVDTWENSPTSRANSSTGLSSPRPISPAILPTERPMAPVCRSKPWPASSVLIVCLTWRLQPCCPRSAIILKRPTTLPPTLLWRSTIRDATAMP